MAMFFVGLWSHKYHCCQRRDKAEINTQADAKMSMFDMFDHLEWEGHDFQSWILPLLVTGVCLAVGVACKYTGIVASIFHGGTMGVSSDSTKKLINTGSGAHVWWSLFHEEHHLSKDHKKTTFHRSLSSIGRFALRSQTKRNPSIITFFVSISNEKGQKEIGLEEFGELIQERVMPNHERFRSKICADDDRYFEINGKDIDNFISSPPHPTFHNVELFSRVHEYLTTPMDVKGRLWEAQISTGPMGSSGCIRKELAAQLAPTRDRETLALFRVHHALCDGVSLSVAVGDLCDEADDLNVAVAQLAKDRKERAKKRSLIQTFIHLLDLIMFYTVGTFVALTLQTWRTLVCHAPFHQVMATKSDEDTSRTTTWRHVAPLKEVKEVARSVSKGATVNDLMVACLTGALFRQLAEHEKVLNASGVTIKIPKNLNVVVPVHLYGGVLLRGQSLGNKIGAFVTAIPARGKLSPGDWLKRVSSRLMEGKTTPAALIAWWVAKIFSDFTPLSLSKWALRYGNAHASAVVSNVRGFPFTTHWNGRRLEHLSAFLPLPPGIPVGIVAQSYDGVISFSVTAEVKAVPDAEKFADWVIEEYEILKSAASENY